MRQCYWGISADVDIHLLGITISEECPELVERGASDNTLPALPAEGLVGIGLLLGAMKKGYDGVFVTAIGVVRI